MVRDMLLVLAVFMVCSCPQPSERLWIILQIKQPQTRSDHYAGEPVHGTPWDSTGEPHACDAALNQLMDSLPL